MARSDLPDVLITGATGSVGTLLSRAWALDPPWGVRPVWSARSTAARVGWLAWDMAGDGHPDIPPSLGAILHLARSPNAVHDLHLAREALRLARDRDVPLLIASSVAVYGNSAARVSETAPSRPITENGRAKLRLERQLRTADKVSFLRIGNVVGADALLGGGGPSVALDSVAESGRGPLRSWIGPRTLARVLGDLLVLAVRGVALPRHLNIAQEPALGMADLAEADQRDWQFSGQWADVGCVRVDCRLLQSTIGRPVPPADAPALVAEWRSLTAVSP